MDTPSLALWKRYRIGLTVAQMTIKSAMPQLIPFFFVNETTVAFILLPSLIYVFSKYILPQKVRLFAARLFISKL
jgi:F-type H+-transporting ATPase subunit 8